MEKQEKVVLKIDPETATAFKTFAKKWRTNHSNTLQLMMDFFKRNGMSPTEDLRPSMISLETRLSRQIGTLIAILRNIENTRIRPTHAMLELLFHSHSGKKKGILMEKKEYGLAQPPSTNKGISSPDTFRDHKRHDTFRTVQKLFTTAAITKGPQDNLHLSITLSEAEFQHLLKNLKPASHVS